MTGLGDGVMTAKIALNSVTLEAVIAGHSVGYVGPLQPANIMRTSRHTHTHTHRQKGQKSSTE